jgi:hypothetical protein
VTTPTGPIDWARQQQTEREQHPVRKLLDQMSDAELAHLYGERDLAVSLLARVRATSAQLINNANARADKAEQVARSAAQDAARALTGYLAAEQRAEQAEAAIARVRAAHLETADGRCSDCLVHWPCPDICRLDGPPGCRNCDEYHSRPV